MRNRYKKVLKRKPRNISDDLELRIAAALDKRSITFIHESEGMGFHLDFYLPDLDIYIEVKKFHTDRVISQLVTQENVVLIQGRKSVEFLEKILDTQQDS